ncbi:MAG TPA: hypothetical protein V6C52_05110 [Coleofasciculaceae cyanobacterium]|jgi:hypothetical protein
MMTRPLASKPYPQTLTSSAEKQTATPLQFGFRPVAPAKIAANRLIRFLDFHELAATTVPQVMVIYAGIILSRFLSAIQRMREDPQHRTNEIRETATRDPLGYALWIFGIPLLQRVFLRFCIPKKYRESLTDASMAPESTQGLRGKLRWLNRKLNPLRWSIPSREQVDNQMRYALEKIKKAGFGEGSAEFQKVHHFYEKGMLRWRNMATLLGWTVTIGLLGVGVMLFNIQATRKRNAQQMKSAASPGRAPVNPAFGNPAVSRYLPPLQPANRVAFAASPARIRQAGGYPTGTLPGRPE